MNSDFFFYKSAPFYSKEIVSGREIAKDPENIKEGFAVVTNIQCFSKYIKCLENNCCQSSHNSNKLSLCGMTYKVRMWWGGTKVLGPQKKSI